LKSFIIEIVFPLLRREIVYDPIGTLKKSARYQCGLCLLCVADMLVNKGV